MYEGTIFYSGSIHSYDSAKVNKGYKGQWLGATL